MNVYLLRHGEAVSERVDPCRPLTPQGRDQVERVSRRAVARGLEFFEILHSGKLRARESAEILARCASPARGVREIRGLDPQADPFIAKAEIEAAARTVALVGHMPHLGRLAALLLTGDPDRPRTALVPGEFLWLAKNGAWKIVEVIAPEDGSL